MARVNSAAMTRLRNRHLLRPARTKRQPVDYGALQQTYARMSISRFQSAKVATRDPTSAMSSRLAYPCEYERFNGKLKSYFL